jgi:hypothetical protein
MGPSDALYNLDKIITHYIYMFRSTLVGHKCTQNGTVILQNRSDLSPILYGCSRTGLNKPQPVTIKILLDSGASASISKHQFVEKLFLKHLTAPLKLKTAAGEYKNAHTQVDINFTFYQSYTIVD